MLTGGLHKLQQVAREKIVFIYGVCTHLTLLEACPLPGGLVWVRQLHYVPSS